MMKITSVQRRLWLLQRWGMSCIICGESFHSLSSVTFEHVKPESMGGTKAWTNIAPSHYNCNKARGTKSLLQAAYDTEVWRAKVGEKQFLSWIRKAIPNCDMPRVAQMPLVDIQMSIPVKWTGGDQYVR